MKLTCRDLGGPCDTAFTANTFEEIGKKSREHVMDQMARGDVAHLCAANGMRTATPYQKKAMMAEFKRKFDEAPNL
jgi:hypothetical protein